MERNRALPAEEIADVVAKAADDSERAYEEAIGRKDWHQACEHISNSLIRRSLALALRLGFAPPQVLRVEGGVTALAAVLALECLGAMRKAGENSDPSSDYQKAAYIRDVVLGVAGTLAALQGDIGKPADRLSLVMLSAFTLGRYDMALAMAEDGHWDTIGRVMRARSAGGKATALASRESSAKGWKADAWRIVHEHIGQVRTRNGWATLIKGEGGAIMPSERQIEEWLKAELEAPNGPLPSRQRTKRA